MGFGNLTKSLKKIKIDRTIYQQISVYISVRNKKKSGSNTVYRSCLNQIGLQAIIALVWMHNTLTIPHSYTRIIHWLNHVTTLD